MKSRRQQLFVTILGPILAAVLYGTPTCGQDELPDQPPPIADAPSEVQGRWEYYVPIRRTTRTPGAAEPQSSQDAVNDGAEAPCTTGPDLTDFLVTPEVFSHARFDLADLRLFDGTGRAVPYALRVLRPQSARDIIPTDEFNRSEFPDGSAELTVDLNRDDLQHNEIEISTSGQNFRRAVEAEGSDDGRTWRPLAKSDLMHFEADGQRINVDAIHYPPSRFRYLRIRVAPDSGRKMDVVHITSLRVLRQVDIPGESLRREAVVGKRQPVRSYGAPSSAWTIDLGGDRVPCERIEVDVAESEFARDIAIEFETVSDDGQKTTYVQVALSGGSTWQRHAGQPRVPMVATFNEVQTRRLKLIVMDHRNPPLTIRSVTYGGTARQVVFSRPANDSSELRLFFGNPSAEPPNYDFARNLPAKLDPAPTRAALGEVQQNPEFVPPPRALTERFPWLIYAVLCSVCVILAAVIVSLARTAVANHDANVRVAESA